MYNADAGTQILAQYLTRYGLRETGVTTGHVARATYAAYNGGPDAYARYRTGRGPRRTRATSIPPSGRSSR